MHGNKRWVKGIYSAPTGTRCREFVTQEQDPGGDASSPCPGPLLPGTGGHPSSRTGGAWLRPWYCSPLNPPVVRCKGLSPYSPDLSDLSHPVSRLLDPGA
ncbi:hypothetical protein GCM10010320_75120 [Streptomyces caelestis]|nr:hypothetical protein GCM10010320_75120 [Streptomyces caelestis]